MHAIFMPDFFGDVSVSFGLKIAMDATSQANGRVAISTAQE